MIGRIGAGKTTIVEHLNFIYNLRVCSFSTPLKKAVSDLFDIPLSDFYAPDRKNQLNPYWNKTPRTILQVFATECIQNHFGYDFWVRRMEKILDSYNGVNATGGIAIDDVRFPEEAEMIIKRKGVIIKVDRPNNPYQIDQSHVSEQMDDIPFNFKVKNDSDLRSLHEKIAHIMMDVYNREGP